jgi:hypothetical protein
MPVPGFTPSPGGSMRPASRFAVFTASLCLALPVILVAAPACAAVVRIATRQGPAPDPRRTIEVLEPSQSPTRPVRVLGLIRIDSKGPASLTEEPDHAFWARMFRGAARGLEADAVVGLHFIKSRDGATQLVTGLAVEYLDAPSPAGCGCVIVVPRARVATGMPDAQRDELEESLQASAAMVLEKKGWYVVWPRAGDPGSVRPGQFLAGIGQPVDAALSVSVDTLASTTPRTPPSSHSIVSDPGIGYPARARTSAVITGVEGDTTWSAEHVGSGLRWGDLPLATLGVFRTYAGQRYRELETLLAEAPRPGR